MTILSWLEDNFTEVLPYDAQNVRVNCPFCAHTDTNHHLHVSTDQSMFHCFRCGESGSWVSLIKRVERISTQEALSRIQVAEGYTPLWKLLREQHAVAPISTMPEDFITIQDAVDSSDIGISLAGDTAKKYVRLRLRNLPKTDAHYAIPYYLERWGVWRERGSGSLVMPVEAGWWQQRSIWPGQGPKYISSHSPKEARLFNAGALNTESTVYVAEGIFSAVYLGKAGIALCGKEVTNEQLYRLERAPVSKYVVCLDSDAEQDALKLAEALHGAGKEVVVRKYYGGDPAEYDHYDDTVYESTLTTAFLSLSSRASTL